MRAPLGPQQRTKSMDGSSLAAENLSRYVKRIMKQKGFTLRDVEMRSGGRITDGYVSSIINGVATNPSVEKIRALSDGLGVDIHDLFEVACGSTERASRDEAMNADQFRMVVDLLNNIANNGEFLEIVQEVLSLTPEERRVVLKMLRSLNEPSAEAHRAKRAS